MKKVIITLILVILSALTVMYVSNRHQTEARFQRNTLSVVQNTPDDQIGSIYLRWRWGNPERDVTLTTPKDIILIVKLMETVRNDLWVDNREINPSGSEPPPMYDDFIIKTLSGKEPRLYCWFGKEGGTNPSLTMRSKKGDFKKIVQEIIVEKGKVIVSKKK